MSTLTYCFTRDEGKYNEERIGHKGPHQVGLGLLLYGDASEAYDGRWVLQQAITLAEDYQDDRDDDIALVRPLLTRPEVRAYFVEVNEAEQAALLRLLTEAQDYWVVNDYASDDEEQDRILGQLAESAQIRPIGTCLDLKMVTMP